MPLIDLLERRPSIGLVASASGFAGSFLTFINFLTPILGFASAAFGCAVGYLTFRVQLKKWRALNKK